MTKRIHPNSIASIRQMDVSEREKLVLQILMTFGSPMTDRQVLETSPFSDMNAVRPRITELVQEGYLCEVGDVTDDLTGRPVRMVEIAPDPEIVKEMDQFSLFGGRQR